MAVNEIVGIAKRPLRGRTIVLVILALLVCRLLLYSVVTPRSTSLPDAVCKWDCGWYLTIVDHGYMRGLWLAHGFQANWAFFPLFPALVRAMAFLLHGNGPFAGFFVANANFCIFAFFAARYYQNLRADGSEIALLLFLFAFPYGFYFSVPYTESTYAGLSIIFFMLERRQVFAASLLASCLAATRVTGVLLTPIIIMRRLILVHRTMLTGNKKLEFEAILASILPISLAPLGLFIFIAYLYIHTGDALAFLHVQISWGRTPQNPFSNLFRGFTAIDIADMYSRHYECAFFASLCAMSGFVMAARILVMKRFAESWFLAVSIVIPLSSGLGSIPRFVLTNPVFIIYLFDLIWQSRPGKFFAPLVFGCAVWQLYLVELWSRGYVSLV